MDFGVHLGLREAMHHAYDSVFDPWKVLCSKRDMLRHAKIPDHGFFLNQEQIFCSPHFLHFHFSPHFPFSSCSPIVYINVDHLIVFPFQTVRVAILSLPDHDPYIDSSPARHGGI